MPVPSWDGASPEKATFPPGTRRFAGHDAESPAPDLERGIFCVVHPRSRIVKAGVHPRIQLDSESTVIPMQLRDGQLAAVHCRLLDLLREVQIVQIFFALPFALNDYHLVDV